MKKNLFYVACGLVGVAVGIAVYSWRQATYVPESYQLSGEALYEDAVSAEQLFTQKLGQGSPQAITLTEKEVSQLLAGSLATEPYSENLMQAAEAINTSIQADRIEAGMVMNLSELPTEALPVEARQVLAQLEQRLPMVVNRNVYVSVSGRPQVEAGRLVFDDQAVVRIGRFRLPLVDLASQVGIAPEDLETLLADYLNQQGIRLEAIDLQPGQLSINFEP